MIVAVVHSSSRPNGSFPPQSGIRWRLSQYRELPAGATCSCAQSAPMQQSDGALMTEGAKSAPRVKGRRKIAERLPR
jgi:hypothetical protein